MGAAVVFPAPFESQISPTKRYIRDDRASRRRASLTRQAAGTG
jgi:hypothetical protein